MISLSTRVVQYIIIIIMHYTSINMRTQHYAETHSLTHSLHCITLRSVTFCYVISASLPAGNPQWHCTTNSCAVWCGVLVCAAQMACLNTWQCWLHLRRDTDSPPLTLPTESGWMCYGTAKRWFIHPSIPWIFLTMLSASLCALVLTNCGCFSGQVRPRWHAVPFTCTRHGEQQQQHSSNTAAAAAAAVL
jgi:hypothetical protein